METRHSGVLETDCEATLKIRDEIVTRQERGVGIVPRQALRGRSGGLVGDERSLWAYQGKDERKTAGGVPEQGSGEGVGSKLQQVKGNENDEMTGGVSNDG